MKLHKKQYQHRRFYRSMHQTFSLSYAL